MLQQHEFEFDQDSVDQYLGGSPPPPSSSAPDNNRNSVRYSMESEASIVEEDFEKSVLTGELQCVGLNPHYRSEWAMTVLKILSYPELISSDYEYVCKRYIMQNIGM